MNENEFEYLEQLAKAQFVQERDRKTFNKFEVEKSEEITKELLDSILQFQCPNCNFSGFDPGAMKDHLISCDPHENFDKNEAEDFINEASDQSDTEAESLISKTDDFDPLVAENDKENSESGSTIFDSKSRKKVNEQSKIKYLCPYEDCNKTFKKIKGWKTFENHVHKIHKGKKPKEKLISKRDILNGNKQSYQKSKSVKLLACEWPSCKLKFKDRRSRITHKMTHIRKKQ